MITATSMAAVAAVLALAGSLAMLAGPLAPTPVAPPMPGAEAPGPDAASWFSGSGTVEVIRIGEQWTADGVGHLRGHVTTMDAETLEVDDPRAGGNGTFTQHADDYGDGYVRWGPVWGLMRYEDDVGIWAGEMTGYLHGGFSRFSGWLTGEGAYEGLIQYREFTVAPGSARVAFSGGIFPADALPLDSDLTPPEPAADEVAEEEDQP